MEQKRTYRANSCPRKAEKYGLVRDEEKTKERFEKKVVRKLLVLIDVKRKQIETEVDETTPNLVLFCALNPQALFFTIFIKHF